MWVWRLQGGGVFPFLVRLSLRVQASEVPALVSGGRVYLCLLSEPDDCIIKLPKCEVLCPHGRTHCPRGLAHHWG